MNEPFVEADNYFVGLWNQAKQKLIQREVKPAVMVDGLTVPVDYCVSTIAKISQQSTAPLAEIQRVTTRFSELLPTQFFYPQTSLHISLLGCTQRVPDGATFTGEHIERISAVCESVISQYSAVDLSLKGVGLVGNQAFIQVFPHSRQWENIRSDLEKKLLEAGETPISYPNKAPIHLNFMRLLDASPKQLDIVDKLIEEIRAVEIAEFRVDVVELLITDFVVSTQNTRVIKRFCL